LSSAFGADLSPEEQGKKFAEDERQREDLVAQCMSEKGFEYIPNLQDASVAVGSADLEWDPESREWVAQYGYGIINYPGRDMPTGEEGEYVDANANYVASLSASEQQAFNEALNGPAIDPEEMPVDADAMEWDWTTAGCYGWAENERGTTDPLASDEHKPLMDAINELHENTMSSPELAEVDAAWSSCMMDAGQPGFSTQMDAQNSIVEESDALYEETGETEPDEAAMKELGDKETELALVDLDCREKTGYQEKLLDVQYEQEQQFVDDHKAELEAFRADLEQGS